MAEQEFIFTSGLWLGEGKITFSASSEFLKFYTKWKITQEDPDEMKAVQIVEMQGIKEQVINTFTFKEIKPTSFTVILENNMVGIISGKGLRSEQTIAWEFRGHETFEGLEVYERQENGDYFLHAEYGASDQFRTIVEGLIWRKGS
jgi:hypothetical protein